MTGAHRARARFRFLLPSFALGVALFASGCGAGAAGEYNAAAPGEYGAAAPEAPSEMPAPAPPGDADYGFSFDDAASIDSEESGGGTKIKPRSPAGELASPEPAPISPSPDAPSPNGVDTGVDRSRAPLLIYQASLTLGAFEVPKHIERIERLATEAGGYLVQRSDLSVTVRVPAAAFGATLDSIAKEGDEIHREVRVQDVTAAFTDLEIRLQNARVVRGRFEELLAKATKVEEALAIERELERLSREIDLIVGRLKLMGELVHFSTITVGFEPRQTETVQKQISLPFPWLHDLGLSRLLSL